MKIKALLFDLDGTLADTLPLCIQVYQQAFAHFAGRSFTVEEVTAHFGLTEAGIFKRVLPEQWEAGLNYYYELYESQHAACSAPYAGIKQALRLLQERDVAMAVVTGKGMHTAEYTLQYLGLAPYFTALEAGQEHAVAKTAAILKILAGWQIAPEDAAYIGDTAYDMQEADKAGVLPLAADWGEMATINLLENIQPCATFTTVADFVDWIDTTVESVTDIHR